MSKLKPFTFNDENVYNCYGFRILNAGISLARFQKNPVMLDDHWMSNRAVLGKWDDVKFEGVTLTGMPVFDMDDADAAKIAGKVERGFIKSCSMGFLFKRDDMILEPNGNFALTKCELMEVSIVSVPANANAVTLYVENDGKIEAMKDDEVKMCLSALQSQTSFQNKNSKNDMKKVFLSVASLVALGLDKNYNPADGIDIDKVDEAIADLKSKLDLADAKLSAAELGLKKFKEAEAEKLDADVKAFVDGVIPAKYDETDREMVTKMAKADLAFAKQIADKMPVKASLAGSVNNSATDTGKGADVKTMDDFQKLDEKAQLAFKNQNPDAYKALVASM